MVALPSIGFTVTVTVVPRGIFEAASVMVIGLAVSAGSVISGVAKEPVGDVGVATPATDVIAKPSPFGSARTPGCAIDEVCVKLIVAVLVNASMRIRPTLPLRRYPYPPETLIEPPLPVMVVATNRTAPPLPPPP